MVAIPTVHMNGTSYDELMRQVTDAYKAIEEAKKALREMAPNARDYYLQGPGEFELARAKHTEHLMALQTVLFDLADVTEGILNQKRD